VKFPCSSKLTEDIDWARLATAKSRKRYIYLGNIGHVELGLDPRFTVLNRNQSQALVMDNATLDDSAFYQCVEHARPRTQRVYGLTVEGKFWSGQILIVNVKEIND